MNKNLIVTLVVVAVLLVGLVIGASFVLFERDPDALTDDQERMVRLVSRGDAKKAKEMRESLREVNRMRRKFKDGTFLGPDNGQSHEAYLAERAEREAKRRQNALGKLDEHLQLLREPGHKRIKRSLAMSQLVASHDRRAILAVGEIAIDDSVYRLENTAREGLKGLPSLLRQAVLGLRPVSFWQSASGEEILYFLLSGEHKMPADCTALFAGTPHPHNEEAYVQIYNHFYGEGAYARALKLTELKVKRDALKSAADKEGNEIRAIQESEDVSYLRKNALEADSSKKYTLALFRLRELDRLVYVKTCLDLCEENQPWWKRNRAGMDLGFGYSRESQADNVAILSLRPESWWTQKPFVLAEVMGQITACFDADAFPDQPAKWSGRAVSQEEVKRLSDIVGWNAVDYIPRKELESASLTEMQAIVENKAVWLTDRSAALRSIFKLVESSDNQLSQSALRVVFSLIARDLSPSIVNALCTNIGYLEEEKKMWVLSQERPDTWMELPHRRFLHALFPDSFMDIDATLAAPLTEEDVYDLREVVMPQGPQGKYLMLHGKISNLNSLQGIIAPIDPKNTARMASLLDNAPGYFHTTYSHAIRSYGYEGGAHAVQSLFKIAFDPDWARYRTVILLALRQDWHENPQKPLNLIASQPKEFWQSPQGERTMGGLRLMSSWREVIEKGGINWSGRTVSLEEFDAYVKRFESGFTGVLGK